MQALRAALSGSSSIEPDHASRTAQLHAHQPAAATCAAEQQAAAAATLRHSTITAKQCWILQHGTGASCSCLPAVPSVLCCQIFHIKDTLSNSCNNLRLLASHLPSRSNIPSRTAILCLQFSHAVMTTYVVAKGFTAKMSCYLSMNLKRVLLDWNEAQEGSLYQGLKSPSVCGGCRGQSWPQQQDQQ